MLLGEFMNYTKTQFKQRQDILRLIYVSGEISRTEIYKKLGITPATTSEITRQLINEGVIIEKDFAKDYDGPGRSKILLTINEKYKYYLGVEIYYRKLVLLIADNMGRSLYHEELDFDLNLNQDYSNENNILKLINSFLRKHSKVNVEAIGFAIPGHYDPRSKYILTNDIFFKTLDLEYIKSRTSLDSYFMNNVKAMSLAHLYFENADGIDNKFLFLHIRNGMYLVNVYDGEFYGKDNKLLGEIGHFVVNPDGEQCECGKKGCLQTLISNTWIIKKAKKIYEFNKDSIIRDIVNDVDQIDIDVVIKAYLLGDNLVVKTVDKALTALSIMINNLMIVIDSKLLVIHNQLLSSPEIGQVLRGKIEENASLLNMRNPQRQIFKPYKSINGALGGIALCVMNDLIQGKNLFK